MAGPFIFNGINAKALTSTASANNFVTGYATTATAAGTTTLTNISAFQQYFTGTLTQTVLLPVVSTLTLGQQFLIVNLSTNAVTVQSSGGNSLQALAPNSQLIATCISLSGTGTASWAWSYLLLNTISGTYIAPTQQTFTSGSGTYTTPTLPRTPLFIQVYMVGGGGGGGGSGTGATLTTGGNGGNTTFGTSLLTANGGQGGLITGAGAAGGTASISSPAFGIAFTGNGGSVGNISSSGGGFPGIPGAPSPLFGGGGKASLGAAGSAGAANSGGGGAGGGCGAGTTVYSASNGASGGALIATINNPTTSYSYAVGAAGTAGAAGTSGFAGGAGGSGSIIVMEFYQ